MLVQILPNPFEPLELLVAYGGSNALRLGKSGATNIFIGNMRDFNMGDTIKAMEIEYYPGMTEKRLNEIAVFAVNNWELDDALIAHRVGHISIGEAIVLVSTWASHRQEAFAACRYIIEELKHTAPFWKKETLSGSQRWVDINN